MKEWMTICSGCSTLARVIVVDEHTLDVQPCKCVVESRSK